MSDGDENLRVSELIDNEPTENVGETPARQQIPRPDLNTPYTRTARSPGQAAPEITETMIPQVVVQTGGEQEIPAGLPFDPILLVIGVWRRVPLVIGIFIIVSGLGFLGALAARHHDWQVYASVLRKSDQKEYLVTGTQPIVKLQTYTMPTVLKLVKTAENLDEVMTELGIEADSSDVSQAIVINNPKDTEVIELIMTWPDVNEAVKIVNRLAEVFIEHFDRLQKLEAYQAFDYLSRELTEVRHRIDELESELLGIKEGYEIVHLSDQTDKLLHKLSEFDVLAYKERLDVEMAWSRVEQIEVEIQNQAPSIVGTTYVKKPVHGRLAQLETNLAKVLSTYTEAAPQVKELRDEIEMVRELIRNGIEEQLQEQTISRNPIVSALEQELVDSRLDATSRETRAAGYENAVRQFRDRLMELPAVEVRLADTTGRLDTLRSVEAILAIRVEEVRIIRDSTSANLSLTARAKAPRYPLPSKAKLVLAAGIILGLGLGFVTALGLELMDTSIKSSGDMTRALSLDCLAEIPVRSAADVLLGNLDGGALVEVFRQLVTTLVGQKSSLVVMIAGADHFEGRTTITINLARVAAKRGLKVCLVDGDLKKPNFEDFGPRFGVETGRGGLAEVLRNEISLADALVKGSERDEPTWLPVGHGPARTELFARERLKRVVSSLRQNFDLIVIDTPPILTSSAPELIACHADAILMVIETFGISRGGYSEALQRLQATSATVVGAVVNKVPKYYEQQFSLHRFIARGKDRTE